MEGPVTYNFTLHLRALHTFGGVLERPLDTFFWDLTISGSWLLAHVWSGPKDYHFGTEGVLQRIQDSDNLILKATSHTSQEPWPCDGEDPWLSSKGNTMGVGKAVLGSHGPSSLVWSENDHFAGPLHILLAEKEGRIWFNIICFKLYQFERICSS